MAVTITVAVLSALLCIAKCVAEDTLLDTDRQKTLEKQQDEDML
jgi:hypothetical protein